MKVAVKWRPELISMAKQLSCIFAALITSIGCCYAGTPAPAPYGPLPTENQMRWQEREFYAFVHFALNTYTDQSWGYGNEDIKLFNPTKLDVRQWARTIKQAGMKGIIITAKHHSGFALWPSMYTDYSVKNAPWKNGQGDLVRELSDACKEYGLKFGVYLSPWDRNRADYGKPEYITYFRNQLTELLTNYGPVFEIWFDGANGGSGHYGGANETRKIDAATYYDWQNTYALVRKLQPNIVIWNDGGDRADLRWVGTEAGYVGETNWSLLNGKGEVTWDMLHHGLENGDSWVPAEVNTSIRPEWFYHPSEDAKVKTVPTLLDTYYNSVGRNATLLLNFPITPDGQIHVNDEHAAIALAKALKKSFAINLANGEHATASNVRGGQAEFSAANAIDSNKNSYWATDENVLSASLTIELKKPVVFNRFLVQEAIRLGQRVKAFTVEAMINGNWKEVSRGTTIGYKRILRFPSVTAQRIRFNVTDSKSNPVISTIGLFNASALLDAPLIARDQAGNIRIQASDVGPSFYYTLDGSTPTTKSTRFAEPIPTDGKVQVKAIAFDPATRKSSAVAVESFDISRKQWQIVGIEDPNAYAVLDGDTATAWHQRKEAAMPVDLIIDLGGDQLVSGFKYFPDQRPWTPGIISHYEFYTSTDNELWNLVDHGEFANIKNNPVWQVKRFPSSHARYIKLRALKNTAGNNEVGYADVDVLTN